MKSSRFKNICMAATLVVPLNSAQVWKHLSFSKIPQNQVKFEEGHVAIGVEKSASPLVYPFNKALKVNGLKVKGRVSHLIGFDKPQLQGEKGHDDSVLRIGLVVPGDKKLNWASKLVAADWVKELHALAPKGMGLDHIYFFKLVQSEEIKGRERVHPLSDLIKEKNEWVMKAAGEFELSTEFQPKDVIAIWVSVDGDDSGAKFQLLLSNLELNLAAEN